VNRAGILSREGAKRLVRSALVQAPGLYEHVADRRILWMDRLGKVHDRDLLALPRLLTGSSPMVVDVGANRGQTVLSVKRILPGARLVSFEPDPGSVAALQRLRPRFPDLRIEPVGLGDRDDEADLYVPVYNGKVMSGLASFDYESAATWMNKTTVWGFRADRLDVRVVRAPIRRLDDFHLDPDVIKIDAQGFEDKVVAGGLQTIERARPVLFIENPSPELVLTISGLGYAGFECAGDRLVPSTGTTTNQYFLLRP
jgi:FkbM family methyltransferase